MFINLLTNTTNNDIINYKEMRMMGLLKKEEHVIIMRQMDENRKPDNQKNMIVIIKESEINREMKSYFNIFYRMTIEKLNKECHTVFNAFVEHLYQKGYR